MQDLIQGKFQFEWAAHATGDMAGGTHAHRVVGKPTLAQMGHQRGAAERMRRLEASAGGPGSPNTASLKLTKVREGGWFALRCPCWGILSARRL